MGPLPRFVPLQAGDSAAILALPRDAPALWPHVHEQSVVRRYNRVGSIVQDLDFGHTATQICFPMGAPVRIDPANRAIEVEF